MHDDTVVMLGRPAGRGEGTAAACKRFMSCGISRQPPHTVRHEPMSASHDRHECEIGPLLRDSHERLLAVQHVDDLIVSRGA